MNFLQLCNRLKVKARVTGSDMTAVTDQTELDKLTKALDALKAKFKIGE